MQENFTPVPSSNDTLGRYNNTYKQFCSFAIRLIADNLEVLKMHNNKRIKAALGFVALIGLGSAQAGQTNSNTGTLGVSATISPECAVAQNAGLSIAKLTMLDTSTAAQDTTHDDVAAGSLHAICTNGTATPMLRFSSANEGGTGSFRLVGADTTTFIVYTLWEGNSGSGIQIAYNTDAGFTGFTADGTQKTLNLSMKVTPGARAAAGIQAYSDTITVTTSYGP